MTGARYPQALVDAAIFEFNRRAALYPNAIRDKRLTDVAGTADFRAWAAIAEWLSSGRLPDWCNAQLADGEAMVDWPLMETAAQKALTKIDDLLVRQRAMVGQAGPANGNAGELEEPISEADLAETELRQARLFAIHRAVSRTRQWLDEVNGQLRSDAAHRALFPDAAGDVPGFAARKAA
jgi:hypothetical protein